MPYLIGIDPGIEGAIAIMNSSNGEIIAIEDMPLIQTIVNKRNKNKVDAIGVARIFARNLPNRTLVKNVLIEQVSARPGEGVTSSFSFGRSLGILEGVCAGLELPVSLVAPVTWKRRMRVPADKDEARAMAARCFPKHANLFKRKKDDGRAEAALMCQYQLEFNE